MLKALFLSGGWDGHKPMECCTLIAGALQKRGVETRIETSLEVLNDAANLHPYHVIVPCWTMGEIKHEQSQNLLKAVAAGKGFAGWHGGMGDAFRMNCEYQFAVGGQFVSHPGDIKDYTVEITDSEHEITRGLPRSIAVKSEQYYMHVDPSNHTLAASTFDGVGAPWIKGCRMPAAWIRRYDKGRVFYNAVGHAPEDLANPPMLELTVRGILWAAAK